MTSRGSKIRKVVREMVKREIEEEYASPELVASIAYQLGVELTSAEVVYISDTYEGDIK